MTCPSSHSKLLYELMLKVKESRFLWQFCSSSPCSVIPFPELIRNIHTLDTFAPNKISADKGTSPLGTKKVQHFQEMPVPFVSPQKQSSGPSPDEQDY